MKILLVDYLALAYRSSFGGGQKLSSLDGTPTTILYKAIRTLIAEQRVGQYDQIFVCKDPSRGRDGQPRKASIRKELSADYKSNRSGPKDPLFDVDSRNLLSLLSLLGIPIFETSGYEADDLIGTLAVAKAAEGHQVCILSGDTDFAQVVTEDGSIVLRRLLPSKVETFGYQSCLERFGVPPSKVNDFKALAGDGVDNIPSVPGVGAKTAAKYINKWGDAQTAAQKETKLQPFALQIQKSYQLATIDLQTPISNWEDEPDCESTESAQELLERLNCPSLIKPIKSLCLNAQTLN